jgi:YHS domain-containing protein
MYRLLLVAGLLILFYFLARRALREYLGGKQDPALTDGKAMIQDPVCLVYVPKGDAVPALVGGQTYYFCSQDCAKTFQQRLSG